MQVEVTSSTKRLLGLLRGSGRVYSGCESQLARLHRARPLFTSSQLCDQEAETQTVEEPEAKLKAAHRFFEVPLVRTLKANVDVAKKVRGMYSVDIEKKSIGTIQKGTRRCGTIAQKVGMIELFNEDGDPVPCTLLQIKENEVLDAKHYPRTDTRVVKVGAFDVGDVRKLNKSVLNEALANNFYPKKVVREFHVSEDAVLPVGYTLDASHYLAGMFVDVQAVTKGKGFAGVMKRWGMKGQPASHGQSLTHRQMGSSGGCQDPGKVWRGKRMPGNMGHTNCTMRNMQIYRVNHKHNLVIVKGSVPGNKGEVVYIRDATFKKYDALEDYQLKVKDVPLPSLPLEKKRTIEEEQQMKPKMPRKKEKLPIIEVPFKRRQTEYHYFT
eukprot:Nk52_evm5s244 gene=Nk52_evmTU5s244